MGEWILIIRRRREPVVGQAHHELDTVFLSRSDHCVELLETSLVDGNLAIVENLSRAKVRFCSR